MELYLGAFVVVQSDQISVELTVLVGEASMTLERFMDLGRGAVIPLGGDPNEPLPILANDKQIAKGKVVLNGDRVNVQITSEHI